MRLTILIAPILFVTNAYAQSTITYYDKYGMEEGKAEIKSNESPYKPYEPAPYVSGMPIDLIMKVGAQKQKAYDQRLQWIQNKLDNLNALAGRLLRKYPTEYKHYYEEVVRFANKMNTGNYDLSNTSVFSPLASELNNIEQAIQITYEDIMANGNKSIMQPVKPITPFEVYKPLFSSVANSPQTYIGKNTLEVKRLLQGNKGYSEGLTDLGRVYLDDALDNDVSVTYYFDSLSLCSSVAIYAPIEFKKRIAKELAPQYTQADLSTWIDKKRLRKWTISEEEEQGYKYLVVRIHKL